MSIHHYLTARSAFLARLDTMSCARQHDAFMNEAMETGGRFDAPVEGVSHLWEIKLHSVFANGRSEEEAIRNWKKTARAHGPKNYIEHF